MKSTRAASRYAKALLDLAVELNDVERVKADTEFALNTINSSRDLRLFLASPVVKEKQKKAIIAQLFTPHVGKTTLHFMLLIAQQGREGMLAEIFESFVLQYKASKNILDATVRVSAKVADATIATIQGMLEKSLGKTIDLTTVVDDKLIGGYIIEMDNYRLDASVAGSLQKLKRELISKR